MKNKNLSEKLATVVVFYDVDTQNDFMMDPDIHQSPTALYVPGAEHIRKNIEKLTNYARQNSHYVMGSIDKHADGDAELQKNGGPFPDHCMEDTWGQKKIPETNPVNPVYIENKMIRYCNLERMIGDKKEVFFEKQHYDVFTNPNAKSILEHVSFAVVYGVATDYCVKAAVLGMREIGVNVYVVKNAIEGIDNDGCDLALLKMEAAGAQIVTTDDILNGVVEAHMESYFYCGGA